MSDTNVPECFGLEDIPGKQEGWDPKSPVCAGGLDPAYVDAKGGHVRERCAFFNACGIRVQQNLMQKAAQRTVEQQPQTPTAVTPVTTPRLPPAPVPAPPRPAPATGFQRYVPAVQQMAQAQPPQQPQPMFRPPAAPVYPMHPPPAQPMGYQQMMPVNYNMPQYLAVPETRYEGQSFWTVLGNTVLRSVAKSTGHSIAHLFDTTPLGTPPAPRDPNQGGEG